jgi:hypothetical protein
MPDTESHDRSSTADLLRRVADTVDHPTVESHEYDIAHLFEWAAAFEQRVARIEQLVEVVAAIRADVATIAEGVDPALKVTVAELVETTEHHGLLLARLLDKAGETP